MSSNQNLGRKWKWRFITHKGEKATEFYKVRVKPTSLQCSRRGGSAVRAPILYRVPTTHRSYQSCVRRDGCQGSAEWGRGEEEPEKEEARASSRMATKVLSDQIFHTSWKAHPRKVGFIAHQKIYVTCAFMVGNFVWDLRFEQCVDWTFWRLRVLVL